jgi:hypothetical protein
MKSPHQHQIDPPNAEIKLDPHDLSTEYHLGSNQSQNHLLREKGSLNSLTLDIYPSLKSKKSVSPNHYLQLQRQIHSLKKRNQMLNSFQSYVL